MRRSLVVLAGLLLAAPLTMVDAPVHADPPPSHDPYTGAWPTCGVPPDDDNRYCVISVTRDGVPVGPRVDDEEYEQPYIDSIGPGTVRFGLDHYPAGSFDGDQESDPTAVWRWRVNTGAIHPRELYAQARDVDLTVGGSAATGWTFDLTLRPVPIAWRFYDTGFVCDAGGTCGDDTTTADLEYGGFVTGYVTDLVEGGGYTAAERARRTGLITAYSAQSAYYYYDYDTNSIVVRMGNPHLRSDGVTPVTGSFETFIPNDVLLVDMGVPDPSSLTWGQLSVTRAGTGSVPFSLTHEPGGIRIRLSGIGFSTPRYTIKPKPSRPGRARITGAAKVTPSVARVNFFAPVADGGARITGYVAACRQGTGRWRYASGTRSPVRVGGLPRGGATCMVRAKNRIGQGPWSRTRHT
jgi:hypothetical protein